MRGQPEEISPLKRTEHFPLRAAKSMLDFAFREYLTASEYFRSIGAQRPNSEYGGSRALIYYQMLGRAASIGGMRQARKQYLGLHTGPCPANDEFGAALRIAGYRLKSTPILGKWLENKVRSDDEPMAEANFTFPEGYDRVVGGIDSLSPFLASTSPHPES